MLNKTNIQLMKIKTALKLSKEVLQDKSKEYLTYAGVPIVECPFLEVDQGMVIFKDSSWDFFFFQSEDYKKTMSAINSEIKTYSNNISRILVAPCVVSQIKLLNCSLFPEL